MKYTREWDLEVKNEYRDIHVIYVNGRHVGWIDDNGYDPDANWNLIRIILNLEGYSTAEVVQFLIEGYVDSKPADYTNTTATEIISKCIARAKEEE